MTVDHKDRGTGTHQHRGKSSESLLDKEAILEHLEIVAGQSILDAGCGNGYMAKAFSERLGNKGRVYALDPDESAIAVLRESTRGTNILPLVGDITVTTQIPAATLDLVYLSMVFHGFSSEQIKGFDAEVNRLLKPRGRLAVVEIVKRPTPFGPPLPMRFSPEELMRILNLLPLSTVDIGEYFYLQLFERRDGA